MPRVGDRNLDHNLPHLDEQMKRLDLNAPPRAIYASNTTNSFGNLAHQAEMGRNPFYKPKRTGGKKSRTNKRKISKKMRKNQKRFTKRKY